VTLIYVHWQLLSHVDANSFIRSKEQIENLQRKLLESKADVEKKQKEYDDEINR